MDAAEGTADYAGRLSQIAAEGKIEANMLKQMLLLPINILSLIIAHAVQFTKIKRRCYLATFCSGLGAAKFALKLIQ